MAAPGGVRFLSSIVLMQVLLLAEYGSAQDVSKLSFPGFQNFGPNQPGQCPGLRHSAGPHSPPWPPPTPPGPLFSEDDLTCLVGTELEVPYPIYKQISESFLSTTNILVLCPNNTIVQVQGYAGLKDLSNQDPDNTKVLISSEAMIPASIYLQIVLIQPEEIMIRLPDGEILPHQIYLERYGKKLETHIHGGQQFYEPVLPEDSSPFLFVNNHKKESSYENPAIPFPPLPFYPEGDVPAGPGQVTLISDPLYHYNSETLLQHPQSVPGPIYLEPSSFHQYSTPRPKPEYPVSPTVKPLYPEPRPQFHIPHHVEAAHVLDYPRPKPSPQYPKSMSNSHTQPWFTEHGPAQYNVQQRPVQQHSFLMCPDSHPALRPHYLRLPNPVQAAQPITPIYEQKALLPTGGHVTESSRCSICNLECDDKVHATFFSV